MRNIIVFLVVTLCVSCDNDPVPKPKAFLRLDYPQHKYIEVNPPLPFSFEKNEFATDISSVKISGNQKTFGLDVSYPSLKGTIYITYKKIIDNNLKSFLIDAQNITQKHTQKADAIIQQPYIDLKKRVFGMFYEVGGNAASQSQFYVTDSIKHFVTGSLYFYVKPNYDSILPAADYLKKDIQHIMQTIKWKE